MSKNTKYILLSLPSSITPSHHRDDALDAISATVSVSADTTVTSFPIPEFKIGTLDALVQQADELAKLEAACQGVVGKVGDALKNVLEGDEAQVEKMKTVNDSRFPHIGCLLRTLGFLRDCCVIKSPSISTCGRSRGIKSSIGRISRWRS